MATVVKCIIPDKKVVEVIRLLKPFALDPPVVDPIDENPAPAKSNSNSGISQEIYNFVDTTKNNGGKTIAASQLKEICLNRGGHPTGYSYALKRMLKDKMLKRGKAPNTYEVIK